MGSGRQTIAGGAVMKKIGIPGVIFKSIILIMMLNPVLLMGEEGAEAEPADPGLVLPTIVLEIEDLSIETIEAVLPEEEELLPPERKVPLPAEEIMEVEEPSPDVTLPDYDGTIQQSSSSFVAEVLLGAGSVNNILSQISFYKLGESPRYKLLFLHEMLDGFSYIDSEGGLAFRDGGTGFNYRVDSLDGSFRWITSNIETTFEGNFYELEQGLQDRADYYSLINRFLSGSADISFLPFEVLALHSMVGLDYSSLSLTGDIVPDVGVHYPPTEILMSAAIGTDFLFDTVKLGLDTRYTYRTVTDGPDFEFHRFLANVYCGIELPNSFALNGSAGYFFSPDEPWLIPFELSITGNPVKLLSLRFAGGYRIEEYDLRYVWKELEYMGLPSALSDNHGWFFDAQVKLNADNNIIISLGSSFSTNTIHLSHSDTTDPSTGLFSLILDDDIQKLTTETGVRWNAATWFYLNAKGSGVFLWEPGFTPFVEALIEGVGTDENGKYGGQFSFLFESDFETEMEIPIFDIAIFFKIADNVKLIGEGHDLFYPLLEEERYVREPYTSPGIRGTLKVHITF
jgi:hypothetical protein